MDRDMIITHYRRMPDETFTHFATHEAAGLEPEVVEILRQELRLRGTVPNADAAIDVQLRRLTSEEFEVMVTNFSRLPCPLCGSTSELLNGVTVRRGRHTDPLAACPACLSNTLNSARNSAVAGAMLFLSTETILAAEHNQKALKSLESGEQTEALRLYLWNNRGEWAYLLTPVS